MTELQLDLDLPRLRRELFEGAVHLPGWLELREQRALVERLRELARSPAGFYTPTLRSGVPLRLQFMCFGWHWDPRTYRYERRRTDHDNLPIPAVPSDLAELARAIAEREGFAFAPDILIVNLYDHAGRLGMHQDRSERAETLRSGSPVVSISLGDAAEFAVGGHSSVDEVRSTVLRSGDAFLLGGASRLRLHGIAQIFPDTSPLETGLHGRRLNLTFRQF